MEQGQSYDIRFKLWRATDGEVIDIHSIGKYDEETNIVFGTFQDISEFWQKTRPWPPCARGTWIYCWFLPQFS